MSRNKLLNLVISAMIGLSLIVSSTDQGLAVKKLPWNRDPTKIKERQSHRITIEDRLAAAERAKANKKMDSNEEQPLLENDADAVQGADAMTAAVPGGMPNYYGPEPNWAYSPIIPKFVDTLPGLCGTRGGTNAMGQCIPVAIPDTTSYPNPNSPTGYDEYYEIELGEYTEQMHSSLMPTTLRGYRQVNTTDPEASKFHYLGPLIMAQKDVPVRIKFINNLPTGTGGNLFLPVDTTVMGAGAGPNMMMGMEPDPRNPMCSMTPKDPACYTENRATIHLHGGLIPWISDGTQNQWITPAGETTDYPEGVSVQNVPDMDAAGCGANSDGCSTFYYSNPQSARLMFYHDHAFGITRLNVYAGEVSGYLLTDPTEQSLIGTVLPAEQYPLIIQDKTFVDPNSILTTDPTWPFPVDTTKSNLWLPHVYMPNQNPNDLAGVNYLGRWDYGPWFWPPWPVLNQPYTDPVTGLLMPNLPNNSTFMEAFMDTPIINGTAYPVLNVDPKTYRFRILNGSNDRFWNLQILQADPAAPTEVKMVPAIGNPFVPTCAPGVMPSSYQQVGTFQLPNCWPEGWPTMDNRPGGVPDPLMLGPQMIQIGSEGGFLPNPVILNNIPIGWDSDPKSMTVGNILEHNLLLGPAERADVIVDFSAFPGQTLILYNDAPAPAPALDPRVDYYTGNDDLTAVGGTAPTQPGFGPNTRTIMQINVSNAAPDPAYNVAGLQATLPGVFAASQDPIIVPQAPYNAAYNGNFPSDWSAYVRLQDTSMTFTPLGANSPVTIPFSPKAIAEEFNDDWGRMAAFLGVEVPFTNGMNQTTIFYRVNDPASEVLKSSPDTMTPIGSLDDGTQIWKITHNGVDTHTIHFHLFNVQIINRVDWAGVVKPPEENELGWKETVRANPLEDIIVALRPVAPTVPFDLPNSIRPLDPTMPIGSTIGFKNVDVYGNPVTVTNQMVNYGWEYVWHCHILAHEEMDMMRTIAVAVAPRAPTNLTALLNSGFPNLSWIDNSLNETDWLIQRKNGTGVWATIATIPSTTSDTSGSTVTYVDKTYKSNGIPYSYQVIASVTVGSGIAGYPIRSAKSAPSNVIGPPNGTVTLNPPTQAITTKSPIVLTWTYSGTDQTGFTIQRAVTPDFKGAIAFKVAGSVFTYTDKSIKAGVTYYYRVVATNFLGNGIWSNIQSILTH